MLKYAIILLAIVVVAAYGLFVLAPHALKPSGGRKRWAYLFGSVMLAEVLLFVFAPVMNWWLPHRASTYAGGIDALFYVILAIIGVTFIGVGLVLTYILFKYHADPGRRALYTHGNHKLEMIWTAIPGVVLFLLAIGQIPAWVNVKLHNFDDQAATDSIQIEVTARQWEWRMRYASVAHMAEWRKDETAAMRDVRSKLNPRPDDVRLANEIHCVKGKKTLIHLKTMDVIHSFFLPQMRLKQDALPGKTILVWFEPLDANCEKTADGWRDGRRKDVKKGWVDDKEYIWELACAEYCGSRHSLMRGKVFVHETQADFEDWLRFAEERQSRTTSEPAAAPPTGAPR